MSRQVLAGVVAALTAFALSGCGSANPGVAVHVGDETLSTTHVDELTVAYCEGITPQLESGGATFPMSFVRGYVVRNLTVKAAAEQLAEDYGVVLPSSYEEAVRSLRDDIEANFRPDRVEQALEVDSTGPYVEAVELEVGGILLAEAGDSGADDEAKQARGKDALEEWLSEHPADVNPRYGLAVTNTDLGRPTFVDTSTSFALSPNAVDAEKINSDEGPDQAHTESLPSTQRCG
jgi:peptidyl-prolyl cis-trans isomerase SurA